MKTFRELISWELDQEKHPARRLHATSDESSGRIGSTMMRKLRYLSASASVPKTVTTQKRV